MRTLLFTVLSMSLSGAVVALLVLALSRGARKHMSHALRYYLWTIVILRLLLPFTPQTNLIGMLFPPSEPVYTASLSSPSAPAAQPQPPVVYTQQEEVPSAPPPASMNIGDTLWMAGVVVWAGVASALLLRMAYKYRRFLSQIRTGSKPLLDNEVRQAYWDICREMNIKHPPEVCVYPAAVSPMLVGITRPVLVLNHLNLPADSWQYVFRHELTHLKRRDILYKWLAQFAVCVHWFNPMAYIALRKINQHCDLSCDAALVKKLGKEKRMAYGDTLLASIQNAGNDYEPVASLTLNENATHLKERLESIMKIKPLSKAARAISISLSLLIVASAVFAGAYTDVSAASPSSPQEPQSLADPSADLISTDTGNPGEKMEKTNFSSTATGFHSGYVIRYVISNNEAMVNTNVSADGADGRIGKVYFTEATAPYATNQTITTAVLAMAIQWSDAQSTWVTHNTLLYCRVNEVVGPFTESASALAERFYQERNADYLYAMSSALDLETVSNLMERTVSDNWLAGYTALLYSPIKGIDFDGQSERFYRENKQEFFSAAIYRASEQQVDEILSKSYTDRKLDFFTSALYATERVNFDKEILQTYQDNAEPYFTALIYRAEIKDPAALLERAYKDGRVEYFTALLYSLDDSVDLDAWAARAIADGKEDFFTSMIYLLSADTVESLVEKAYQDSDVQRFSSLIYALEDDAVERFAQQAYKDSRLSYFSALVYALEDKSVEQLAEQAYEDDRLDFFSSLIYMLEDETVAKFAGLSYSDNRIKYFSALVYMMDDNTVKTYREKAQRDEKTVFYDALRWA